MSGRMVAIGLVLFAAVFGAALWYAQLYAFYDETEADSITVAGREIPVSGWQGIDAKTSPLKLRACFRLADGTQIDAPAAEDPTPLVAPPWFDCFDAEAIAVALAEGRARAFLAAEEEFEGANRIVALFEDGRGYMWRQLTPEFADQ